MRHIFKLAVLAAIAATTPALAEEVPAVERISPGAPAHPDAARIETVRADLAGPIGAWTGVRSCGDPQRAKGALQAAFDAWVGRQAMARPGRALLSSGWESSSWSATQHRSHNGARHCRGSFQTALVYARFY